MKGTNEGIKIGPLKHKRAIGANNGGSGSLAFRTLHHMTLTPYIYKLINDDIINKTICEP